MQQEEESNHQSEARFHAQLQESGDPYLDWQRPAFLKRKYIILLLLNQFAIKIHIYVYT